MGIYIHTRTMTDEADETASIAASTVQSECNSELKYGAKVESVLQIWPLGGVECLNPAAPRWSDEPLVYLKPEPIPLGGVSNRLGHYSHSCYNDSFLEKVGLKNPVGKLFADNETSQERKRKIDKAGRDVKRVEMKDLRDDCKTLLVYERSLFPEESRGNARTRMMDVIIKQCMKITDLFEEAAQILDLLDDKDRDIEKIQEKLKTKEDKRFGLEGETEVLRKEIAQLQTTLHNTKNSTSDKIKKDQELNAELKDQKTKGMAMVKTAEVAKGKMTTLKNAMSSAEKAMESTISEIKEESDN